MRQRSHGRAVLAIGVAVFLAELGVIVYAGVLRAGRGPDATPATTVAAVAAPAPAVTAKNVTRNGDRASGAARRLEPVRADTTPEDVEIFRRTLEFARREGLSELAIGDIVVELGRTFVGTPYQPGTLEAPGPERLIVNLRELDCVTFVENALVLARMVRDGRTDFDDYLAELTRVRYRGGELNGYPSRLHYFSEWIADNEAKGLLRDITAELGGIPDPEPIDFMSRNADAYRQLGDPANLEAIRQIERRLNARTRYYIPQERIAEVAHGIRDGDIIAATSTVRGLDVAHTGIAIWVDGRLHLMHAPLVGRWVEISELPLAERIAGISGQDGIMVARPL